jgi:hypothetical protein
MHALCYRFEKTKRSKNERLKIVGLSVHDLVSRHDLLIWWTPFARLLQPIISDSLEDRGCAKIKGNRLAAKGRATSTAISLDGN